MIGLLQRVSHAQVMIGDDCIARIGPGLLVLVAVESCDDRQKMQRLLERLLAYRVFADDNGRMNRSLEDTGGGLLLVPQFTLAANTHKGNRPSFSACADPEFAQSMFAQLVSMATSRHPEVGSGVFGADMQVGLVNDGPVTFWLHVR